MPTAYFKVIAVPTARGIRSVAYVFDNDSTTTRTTVLAARSIRDVEEITHIDFLSTLRTDTQRHVEMVADRGLMTGQ